MCVRKRIGALTIIFLTALSLLFTHLYIAFYSPVSPNADATVTFNVQKGTGFRVVASNLRDAGVIRDSESFIFIASILGAYKRVKAGEYELSGAMTPMEVLDALLKGRVKRHFVTIPEGYNLRDIASTLEREGLADRDEFLSRAADSSFVRAVGVEGPTFEGYLFPDTYAFTRSMTIDEIIMKMAERFKSVYFSEFEAEAVKKGIGMRKLVTFASIIEKETGVPGERGLVSAVFHNRLKKGIKLQSDPTVIYGIKDFDGNIRKSHLGARSPYNTYVVYGLPPGPIASPGRASLRAVLSPDDSDALYFVSRNDGTHYFSNKLSDHNRAVNRYQRHMKRSSQAMNRG